MSSISPTVDAVAPTKGYMRDDRAFLGHPLGLFWLSFCELWERFSFYGMQGLLGLYLANYLFLPEHVGHVVGIDQVRGAIEYVLGPRTPSQLATFIAGGYLGLVYLTPIFGGLVADRWLGRTKTVVLGASLMAIGHFLMAFETCFFGAIACLLVGVGCFKGNIAAQVGDLYAPGDKRRASAFQIFLLAVQIAVIAAPAICGTLGEKVAWHWGFDAAGVGMLFGLTVYLVGRRWLPPEAPRDAASKAAVVHTPLTSVEWQRLGLLVALLPVLMLSIVGNQQFSIGFPLWSDKHMDLVIFGWQMPVTWLQGIDAIVSTTTMLLSIAFWRWWGNFSGKGEPDELMKMTIGALLAAGGPALMIIAGGIVDATHGRVSVAWTLAYTVVNDLGFANILPVGLALYSRVAPRSITGLVIGIYYLHLFIGNFFVGWLAGFMEVWPNAYFWGMNAVLVGAAAVLMLVVRTSFGSILAPDAVPQDAAIDAAVAPAH